MVMRRGPYRPHVDTSKLTDKELDSVPIVDAMTRQSNDSLSEECWSYKVFFELEVPLLEFPYQKIVTKKRKRDRRDRNGNWIWITEICQRVGIGLGVAKIQFRLNVAPLGRQPEERTPEGCTLPDHLPLKINDFCDRFVKELGAEIMAADATEASPWATNESKIISMDLGLVAYGSGRGGMFDTQAQAEAEMQELMRYNGKTWGSQIDIGRILMGVIGALGLSESEGFCWSPGDPPADVEAGKLADIEAYLMKICKYLFEKALKESGEILKGFIE